jgi:hypothetical protein
VTGGRPRASRWMARALFGRALFGLALIGLALAVLAQAGCKKKPLLDEVPDPAPGWVRYSAAGVRMDIPEEWSLTFYDSQAALGPPSTEVTIKPPDSRAMVQLTIIHLYMRDKTDDQLLDLYSLAYTALYRNGVQSLLEIDTQAGMASGMQLDVAAGPTSDGEKHRFWIVRLVGRTIQVHETLPYDTPSEIEGLCSQVVMAIGKSPEYMPGQ